jgi:hypothetical protein
MRLPLLVVLILLIPPVVLSLLMPLVLSLTTGLVFDVLVLVVLVFGLPHAKQQRVNADDGELRHARQRASRG